MTNAIGITYAQAGSPAATSLGKPEGCWYVTVLTGPGAALIDWTKAKTFRGAMDAITQALDWQEQTGWAIDTRDVSDDIEEFIVDSGGAIILR